MQLRVWIDGSEPKIWRRLIAEPCLTLEQLHLALQHAFGWTDSHLHQFHEKNGRRYAIRTPYDDDFGEPAVDERKTLLADVFTRKKKAIAYEYDFGDSWIHIIEFEGMVDSEAAASALKGGGGSAAGRSRAVVCIDGARNGPPEDCGGMWGYERLLELKSLPPGTAADLDEDDREMLEWLGDWDAEGFDLAEINRSISRIRVKKAYANR